MEVLFVLFMLFVAFWGTIAFLTVIYTGGEWVADLLVKMGLSKDAVLVLGLILAVFWCSGLPAVLCGLE